MKDKNAVEIKNLSKRYIIGGSTQYTSLRDKLADIKSSLFKSSTNKQFWALKNVNLEIRRGDVVGIVGRNGAGKSTLLKLISRITEPTSGTIQIRGRVVSLLEVGTGFNFELTGRENIFLNGAILGMTRAEIHSKISDIIEFSGVKNFIDTPVKKYSSGMYVRLAFSVAAHLDADVLLVDEVLSVGDAEFQKKCLGKIDAIAKSGRTVMFVSHNMGSISGLCNKAILIDQGKILKTGEPRSIIQEYLKTKSSSSRDQDLTKIKSRRGKGEVKISKLYFTNEDDQLIKSPVIGTPVKIHLEYKSKTSNTLTSPRFGITITNGFGQVITMLHSFQSENKFKSLKSSGHVQCYIDNFPLMPGNYLFSLGISSGGVLQDEVDYPDLIKVTDGSFFPEGMIGLDPKLQGIFVRQTWQK